VKTTGIFKTCLFRTSPLRSGESFRLVFMGDVHHDAPMMASSIWKAWLRRWKKSNLHNYYLGMGDYLDWASTSERIALEKVRGTIRSLHDQNAQKLQAEVDRVAATANQKLLRDIGFMKGRMIGAMDGNHYAELSTGGTTTHNMCLALDAAYLGSVAWVTIEVPIAGRGKGGPGKSRLGPSHCTLDVVLSHGTSASRLPGGSINRVNEMRGHQWADIFAMAHDHRRAIAPQSALTRRTVCANRTLPRHIVIQHRSQILLRTGGFLRGYVDGQSSYIADAGLPPSDLGSVEIEVTLHRSDRSASGGGDHLTLELEPRMPSPQAIVSQQADEPLNTSGEEWA
jgi:hypothetical protein